MNGMFGSVIVSPERALMMEADRMIQRFGTSSNAKPAFRVNVQVAELLHRNSDPFRRFRDGDVFQLASIPVTVDSSLGFCVAVSYEAPFAMVDAQ